MSNASDWMCKTATEKNPEGTPNPNGASLRDFLFHLISYSCGPAATSAFPAALLSYFAKFFVNL